MKKSILAAAATFAAFTLPANAADLDRDLGLIVSGVVSKWAGVQIIDTTAFGDDTVFANGGEGMVSLPLGDNLSIQTDVKYEFNSYATESQPFNDTYGPRYSFQGAAHLSWRDPSRGLFGVFGGAGSSDFGLLSLEGSEVAFVGGEAQFYLDNITLYGQGGYVRYAPTFVGFDVFDREGVFARGVLRWFLGNDSRIQLEGTYQNTEFYKVPGLADVESFSVGAQYDFVLAGLPLVGDTQLSVGYRGVFRENCFTPTFDTDDHTIMIGTTYSFSGDMLTIDRQGATLDTPDFHDACFVSDRRLKTDIVQLGETNDGINVYSWKYKSDPVTTWVGVMAQDLETTHPQALVTGRDGFYRVNYSKLGVQMMTLEQWDARML